MLPNQDCPSGRFRSCGGALICPAALVHDGRVESMSSCRTLRLLIPRAKDSAFWVWPIRCRWFHSRQKRVMLTLRSWQAA